MFYILIAIFSITTLLHPLQAQDSKDQNWQAKAQSSFLNLLKSHSKQNLSQFRVQLWTVSPGKSVTTAFGHAALRIVSGPDYGDTDFYLDFGVYDPSPGFLWRFMKGEANFFVNIIPTSSAFQTWDSTGRGILVSELLLDESKKHKLFEEILKVYEKNKDGYYYDNFTNNCVTFLRDILSETKGEKIRLLSMDSEKNTWRKRVLPYSQSIIWLNINETLLFDKDTDAVRDSYEIIYLPEDLRRAVIDSGLSEESKVILRDRWGIQPGTSSALWKIIFAIIILFSLPVPLFKLFERYAVVTYSLVSGIGGTVATLVYFFTSFSFMDQTISWLIYSPLDFLLLKRYDLWQNKRAFWSYVALRCLMLLFAFSLRLSIYKQDIDMILFVSVFFFAMLLFKYRNDVISLIKRQS
ncbi:hypothetical protein LPTSP4_12080 [Leptospira ryugenii]|uniref:Lnb N-terminal periplasmic domain-containing protein n=1 Tax=Leptospira ryugenii TaxID=1917863 RepID=A0A2P2DYJ8_9LEPT|nr:DUF4105 domain-containing protein [Leptospira ryugenii]GBF49692.1 hypothetical protein LPTSP4_12080 [Leptospira ryugenii]